MASVGRLVKESMLKELSTALAERPSFFVTRVNRLSAVEADALRQKLFASKAKLVLVQRRLGLRALEALKIPGLTEMLEGSVALVLPSDDVLPTAKLIVEFIKTHADHLSVRGGVVDGQVLDRSRVEQLASLPPRPILLAQVMATIESPLADVVCTVERLIGELAWALEQASQQQPQTHAPETPQAAAPSEAPAQPPEQTQSPEKTQHKEGTTNA